MNHMLTRTLCRLLIALMVWTPFQLSQAAMIGTTEAVPSTSQADRIAVLNLLERSDVASQMQMLGVDPASAKDRVQAMSDEEVRTLAQKIDSLPAGGVSGAEWVLVLLIVGAIVWWVYYRN